MTTETKKLFFIVVILQVLFLCMWLFSMGCYSNGSISKMMEMMESKRSRLKLGQGILDAAADLEKENAEKSKPLCPLIPNGLVGNRKVNKTPPTLEDMERNYSLIQNGQYKPKNCKSRQNVAVLIPFRDRESHLRIFLNHMHPFLMRQQLQYGIYVVEQTKELKFNRGILFNIGFKEASNDSNYDCFILHDVDLLPENDFNIYSCPADHPKHLSVAIDKLNYKLPYPTNFGGVTAVTKEQFEAINGFSNIFYGWGGEDDDLYNRCTCNNCVAMPTATERRCCQSFAVFQPKLDEARITCITMHEAFQVNCLNHHVLELSFYEYLDYNGPIGDEEPVHELYRYIAYRRYTRWLWHRQGKKTRKVIPSCFMSAIRTRFPSDGFTEFKYPRDY